MCWTNSSIQRHTTGRRLDTHTEVTQGSLRGHRGQGHTHSSQQPVEVYQIHSVDTPDTCVERTVPYNDTPLDVGWTHTEVTQGSLRGHRGQGHTLSSQRPVEVYQINSEDTPDTCVGRTVPYTDTPLDVGWTHTQRSHRGH